MDRAIILGAVARGWCSPKNELKVMDPDLAEAIADEIIALDITFDSREVSTMLAALRLWQRALTGESPGNDFKDIASNCGKLVPLWADEIDELCERINV